MSKEERLAFEKEMKIDPTLRSAVDNYDLAQEISLGFLEEEVREVLNEDVPVHTFKRNKYRLWRNIAAAGLILLGLSLFIFKDKLSWSEPVQYAKIYTEPTWPLERGETDDQLSDAIKVALDGQIQAAVRMIQASTLSEQNKNYWIAEIYAKEGISDSVLLYLPTQFENKIQRDRINYLSIISLYNLKQYQQVKQAIDELPADTDEWYLNKYILLK